MMLPCFILPLQFGRSILGDGCLGDRPKLKPQRPTSRKKFITDDVSDRRASLFVGFVSRILESPRPYNREP